MVANEPQLKARAASVSVAANAGLIVLKLFAGLLTGSIAILSDAVHSLVDLGASAVVLFAVRRSTAPPDKDHRYGHSKFEDLSAGVEALLLLLGAAVITEQAIGRLVSGGHVSFFGWGMAVISVAVILDLLVSRYLRRIADRTSSVALAADSVHLGVDAVASTGVLISLLLTELTGAQWIDPVFGLLVAAVITFTGLRILFGSGRRLTDTALPGEEMALITNAISSFVAENAHVLNYHDLRARHSGQDHEVDFHLQFDEVSLHEAHRLSHLLQDRIVAALPRTTVLVHMEPGDRVRPDSFAGTD